MQPSAVLRVARPTDRLAAIAEMYATGLGFTVVVSWDHRNGVDKRCRVV